MKSSVKLKFCRWDLAVAAVILALSLACWATLWLQNQGGGALTAVVAVDGTEIDRFAVGNLTEKTYTANGYTLHVFARGSEIRVAEADCPGQDCVHTGFIDTAGESIVCLPAHLSIRLVRPNGSGGVDAVLG